MATSFKMRVLRQKQNTDMKENAGLTLHPPRTYQRYEGSPAPPRSAQLTRVGMFMCVGTRRTSHHLSHKIPLPILLLLNYHTFDLTSNKLNYNIIIKH